MVTESDPVQPDEYVFRRILNQHDIIDRGSRHPVQRIAFRPTGKDVDGISVFREIFTTAEKVAHSGRSVKGYYVARISVSEIQELGFTVIPDPKPLGETLPGHSLVPELTWNTPRRDSITSQLKLADLVNKDVLATIVYNPEEDAT